MTRQGVAAFDVDGTLTTRDCVGPFLRRVGGVRGLLHAALRDPRRLFGAAVRADRDLMKELLVGGVFSGRTVADVDRAGHIHSEHIERNWLRPDSVARLRRHQRLGHQVVLVSASLGPYLRPLGERLEVDAVLCTDVAATDGVYLDRLDGGNCRAGEKERRLRGWLARHGHGDIELWVYGDSRGDDEMLAMADHPLKIGRGPIGPDPESSR